MLGRISLALMALVPMLGGCSESDGLLEGDGGVQVALVPEAGVTTVHASDGESDASGLLRSAIVTFSSVRARSLDGEQLPVEAPFPLDVDMLALAQGQEFVLPRGVLPPGAYDQLDVVMTRAVLETLWGTTVELSPPEGWDAMVPVCPFIVVKAGTAEVRLVFDRERTFLLADGRFFFKPEFTCLQD